MAKRTSAPLATLSLLIVALLLLSASSCKKKNLSPQERNLSLVHYFSGSLSGGIDELVASFNSGQEGIKLSATALDHESYKTSIGDALAGDNPPELFSYWAGARTQSVIEDLEPIDDIWKTAGLDKAFPAALSKSACEYQGKKYLLPITQHYVGFFYNRRLFEALGLGEPRTWDEFLAVCATAKAAGVKALALGAKNRWPAQFWYDYLMLRESGQEIRRRQLENELPFSSGPSTRAFKRWKPLLDAGYFNPDAAEIDWDEAALRIFEGKALMTLMGTWIIGYYKEPNLGWVGGEDYGFFPFPELDPAVPRIALGPIDGIIVAKKGRDSIGAKQVLAYLAGLQAQEAFSSGSGALSPNVMVPESFYSSIQGEVTREIRASEGWAFNYDLAAPPVSAEIGLDLLKAFVTRPSDLERLLKQADLNNAPHLKN